MLIHCLMEVSGPHVTLNTLNTLHFSVATILHKQPCKYFGAGVETDWKHSPIVRAYSLVSIYKITIFRAEATSALACFHAGSLSWSNWNLEMLVFVEVGKPEHTEKNPSSKARTNKILNQ